MNDKTEEENATDFKTELLWVLGVIGAIVFLVTCVSGLIASSMNCPSEQSWCLGIGLGSFGDSFGFVTSLFTGLAFLGLMYTMSQQRQQIEIAQAERKIAEETLRKTEETLAKQIEAAKLTSSDGTRRALEERFFRLLDRTELTEIQPDAINDKAEVIDDYLNKIINLPAGKLQSHIPKLLQQFQKECKTHFPSFVVWLAAWDCTDYPEDNWMRDLLDVRVDASFFPGLIFYYLCDLHKTGRVRSELVKRYCANINKLDFKKIDSAADRILQSRDLGFSNPLNPFYMKEDLIRRISESLSVPTAQFLKLQNYSETFGKINPRVVNIGDPDD